MSLTPDEQQRLDAIRRFYVLDAPPEDPLARLVRVVADLFGVPIVLLTLRDGDAERPVIAHGLDVAALPADAVFCARAAGPALPVVVPDAASDERFANNPLVHGPPNVRFYAGVPLKSRHGFTLGTLALMDPQTQELNGEGLATLVGLAMTAEPELEMRRQTAEQEAAQAAEKEAAALREQQLTQQATALQAQVVELQGQLQGAAARLMEAVAHLQEAEGRAAAAATRAEEAEAALRDADARAAAAEQQAAQAADADTRVAEAEARAAAAEARAADAEARAEASDAARQDAEAAREASGAVREELEATREQLNGALAELEASRKESEAARQEGEARLAEATARADASDAAREASDDLRRESEAARDASEAARQEAEARAEQAAARLAEAEALVAQAQALITQEHQRAAEADRRHAEVAAQLEETTRRLEESEASRKESEASLREMGRHAEEAATWKHQAELTWAFLDAAPLPLFVAAGPEAPLTYANRAALALFGVPELDALAERPLAGLVAPEEAGALSAALADAAQAAIPPRPVRLSAGERPFLLAAAPTGLPHGGVVAALLEPPASPGGPAPPETAVEREQEGLARPADFLHRFSYDIRTSLTAIVGYAEVMADDLQTDARESADTILLNSHRLLQMLGAVTELDRLERGAVRQPVPVEPVVEAAAATFRPLADRRDLAFFVEPPPPDAVALADAAALGRVLDTLLANALRHTERGGVRLRILAEDQNAEPGTVAIEVQDTGVGIEAKRLKHLFKPPPPGSDDEAAAPGVRLVLAHRLVERMGGRIEVKSVRGQGSVFRVVLPAATVPAPSGDGAAVTPVV
ncbi:MAG TPA: ATP-binding protein [Rubricoccaceae bacterium]|nr:ATP-binding protein [Rubricoccaceae bacterium]